VVLKATDNLIQQFLTTARKIRDELHRVAEELHAQSNAQQMPAAERPVEPPTPPASQELRTLETIIQRMETQAGEDARRENRRDWIAILTLGVFLAYTIAAGYQWWELNTQNLNLSAANISSGATADKTLLELHKSVNETRDLVAAVQAQVNIAKAQNSLAQKTNRPTIAIYKIAIIPRQDGSMTFLVDLRNNTQIEATSFMGRCEVFINDKPQQYSDMLGKPVIVSSGQTIGLCFGNGDASTMNSIQQGVVFDVYVHFEYDGPSAHYKYCTKQRFNPRTGIFNDLGGCDGSKPFPQ
jgi:hypothetical protein